MLRNLTTVFAAMTLVVAVGCKKDKKDSKDDGKDPSAKVDPTPKTDPKPDPKKDAKPNPQMLNDMKNCPSAVKNSKTTVEKDKKVVTLMVTGEDDATVAEIRKRATHLAKASAAEATEVKHTGEGTGGGLGKCPVVLAGATVSSAEVDKGSKLTVTPKDATKLEGVYTMAAERAASMNKRGGVAHGTGASLKHGTGKGGNNNMKHSGKRSGEHGSGTGGGGSKTKNPCGGSVKNPCAKNPCAKNPCTKNPCAKNPCAK